MVRARLAEVEEQRRTAAAGLAGNEPPSGTPAESGDPVGRIRSRRVRRGDGFARHAGALGGRDGQRPGPMRAAGGERRAGNRGCPGGTSGGGGSGSRSGSSPATVGRDRAYGSRTGRGGEDRAAVRAPRAGGEEAFDDAEGEIAALCQPGGRVRWRDRRAFREAQDRLDRAREKYERLRADAAEARRIANDLPPGH